LLALATTESAQCLDLGKRVGSLQPGKEADVITVRQDALHLQPWHDPRAGLVYAARGLDVENVWVAGEQRVSAGKVLAGDAQEAVSRAAAWAEKHGARLRNQRKLEEVRS
jgi:5-methylthioadenosine/S-adenosylhomocysteine deaminase